MNLDRAPRVGQNVPANHKKKKEKRRSATSRAAGSNRVLHLDKSGSLAWVGRFSHLVWMAREDMANTGEPSASTANSTILPKGYPALRCCALDITVDM